MNLKATRSGLNMRIKEVAELPYRSQVRRAWGLSRDDFWDYQLKAFGRSYGFARTCVPYYKERIAAYPPLPQKQEEILEFLSHLPVLKKAAVRQYNTELWAQPRLPLTSYHTTSGTTGTPLRLAATLWERAYLQSIFSDWLSRHLGKRKARTINLSGFMTPSSVDKELFWVDYLSGNIFLSIYSLSPANRDRIVELFERVRPQLIMGYASAMHQLALLLGDKIASSKAERIANVTSEVLDPAWRRTIEASLCKRVLSHYGSQENSHLALECTHGNLHIHPLVGIIEIVDADGRAVKAGDVGRVLVTGLARKSMPLIRYEIGDMAESTGYASNCLCGVGWPTIGPVQGRSEDLVKTRDGRFIGMLAYTTFKNLKGIKEAQLVQRGYENFTCRIVKSATEPVETGSLEAAIRGQLTERLQVGVEVKFDYVASIPRGPNGKFKAVAVEFKGDYDKQLV